MSEHINEIKFCGQVMKTRTIAGKFSNGLALTLQARTRDGERETSTTMNATAWGESITNCTDVKVGDTVLVTGRIAIRKWSDKNGKDQWSTEIAANKVSIVTKAKSVAENPSYGSLGEEPDDLSIPF